MNRQASDLTVVIPTLGRPHLRHTLEAIAAGTSLPAEVIVVHQGDDELVRSLTDELSGRGLPTRYVHSRHRGVAQGRNAGIRAARTRFVAVTDDDCLPDSDWVERLLAELRRHPEAIVTGQVRSVDGVAPGLITDPVARVHDRPLLRRDPVFPDNMGVAREVFDQVGPFDEDPRLRYAEDAEWSYRALKGGIPVRYSPRVVVGHVAHRNLDERAVTYQRYARSQGAFYAKHLRAGDGFVALRTAFDLARGPWMVVRGAVTRQADIVAYGRAYMRQLLPGIVDGLRAP